MLIYIHHSSIWGGGSLSCFDVCKMIGSQHKLVLALPEGENIVKNYAKQNSFEFFENAPNANIFRYYNGGPSLFKALGSFFLSRTKKKEWKNFLKDKKVDAVLLNSIVLWPMLKVFYELGVPTILFIRETQKGRSGSMINRIIKKNIEKYGCTVAFLSNYDKKQWGFSTKIKQCIIPDVVDIEDFEQKAKNNSSNDYVNNLVKSSEMSVLFSGGINRLKGTLIALKAIEMCHSNIKLFLLGDCEAKILQASPIKKLFQLKTFLYARSVKQKLNSLKLKDRVICIGNRRDMSVWYAHCDVCFVPIVEAHQSRSIFEAGVFSKPVVITDFENYYEYLKAEESGIVFPKMNFKLAAQELNRLYKNKKLREHLGEKNRRYTELYHCLNTVSINVKNLIEEIKKEKGNGRKN